MRANRLVSGTALVCYVPILDYFEPLCKRRLCSKRLTESKASVGKKKKGWCITYKFPKHLVSLSF